MEYRKDIYFQTDAAQRRNKIFISHSSADCSYVKFFLNLLEDIGLSEDEIVCSSVPGYGIPLGEDIYDWLACQFQDFNLHIMFMLSNNYYGSVACLNEMGAAWVLKQRYDILLLPDFGFPQIKGAINPNKIGIKLDSTPEELIHRLNEMKDVLVNEFKLKPLSASKWERHRNEFVQNIHTISTITSDNANSNSNEQSTHFISKDAKILLAYAAGDPSGQIIRIDSISGLSICTGKWSFIDQGASAREESRWEDAIIELENQEYITALSLKRQVFRITTLGYKVADEILLHQNIDINKSPEEYTN